LVHRDFGRDWEMTDFTGLYFDRYHLLAPLGEGGMASVYKAFDTRLERDVAVKIIRTDMFIPAALQQVLKRFEREAKSLAKLSHPNIVSIIDYGEHDGVPYLVMEYLPGGTLKDRLAAQHLTWQESFHMLLPVARALHFSHQQGIIHRDIKPSNILITQSGEPMLSDFGIAKILEGEKTTALTGTGVGIGTPEYMAPEQWVGETSPCSDLYSLGVVLYEMVTGRKPYTADTPAAILLKQANYPLPRPRQFVADLPDRVEKIILKALAKKPEDRYSSMEEFSTALENLLSGHAKIKPLVLPVEKPKVEELPPPIPVSQPEQKQEENQPTLVSRMPAEEMARRETLARQKLADEQKARQEEEARLRKEEEARLQREAEARRQQEAELQASQAALEKSRREAQERQQREAEQRAAEINRLQQAAETTLLGGQWGEARKLISQMNNLGPDGQAQASNLRKRLPKQKIPVWVWVVGGLVLVGIILGVVLSRGGNPASPALPVYTPTPVAPATNNPVLIPVEPNNPVLVPTATIEALPPALVPTATVSLQAVLRLNANIRTGPGTVYPVLAVLNAGTQVQVLGRNRASDWLVIALPGDKPGWIAASSVQVGFDPSILAEINPPPPPTLEPLPTAGSHPGGSGPTPQPTLAPP
jgi:serine/threonine protein kinase